MVKTRTFFFHFRQIEKWFFFFKLCRWDCSFTSTLNLVKLGNRVHQIIPEKHFGHLEGQKNRRRSPAEWFVMDNHRKSVKSNWLWWKCWGYIFTIGIKHGFSCINIRQVPWEVLKTEAEGRGCQHRPRDLANVNASKNHVQSLLLHKSWKHLLHFALFLALFCFAFSPMSRECNFHWLCSF